LPIRIGLAYNLKPSVPASSEAASPSASAVSSNPRHARRALHPELEQPDLYAEWDEPETIEAVEQALRAIGEVVRLEANETFPARLQETRPDFVFNIAEGLYGPNRESHVPAICEYFGIPCHASDPMTLSLTLDKGRAKEIMSYYGVPTAPFVVIESKAEARRVKLPFPVFAKPALEGSGKGITVRNVCHTRAELAALTGDLLKAYRQPILVESYLSGPEFTVAVLGNGDEARCLPIVGLRFDCLPEGAPPIYGYEAKWLWDTLEDPLEIYECPARIPEDFANEIRAAALGAYHALGCRDWCRIDIRCTAEGQPMVVELNPLPGILPDPRDNSCLPMAARAEGMSYDELIQTAADTAWRRISGRRLLKKAAAA
jgi:D-alanine-D-alanine ligase